MNLILYKKLDGFVIIYIEDILMCFKTIVKHVEHLEYVLNKLQQNNFFANRSLCKKIWNSLGTSCQGKGKGLALRSCKPWKIEKHLSRPKEFDPS
jgi:hypothetical protein